MREKRDRTNCYSVPYNLVHQLMEGRLHPRPSISSIKKSQRVASHRRARGHGYTAPCRTPSAFQPGASGMDNLIAPLDVVVTYDPKDWCKCTHAVMPHRPESHN
jgi:hypothetical protein